MTNLATMRIQKELYAISNDKGMVASGTTVRVTEGGDLRKLQGTFRGPPDSPYEGGFFEVEMKIPDQYPFSAPKVKFVTRVWHPNVSSQTGAICLDILADQWAASMTLMTVLLSIQSMLVSAEPRDPQDAVVARQYLKDRACFNKTAKYWSIHYAKAPHKQDAEQQEKVDQLVDMGTTMDKSVYALSSSDWDLIRATDSIFGA